MLLCQGCCCKAGEPVSTDVINSCLESISSTYEFDYFVTDMRRFIGGLDMHQDLSSALVLSERELQHLASLKNDKNRLQWISGRYAVKCALFKHKLNNAVLLNPVNIDVLKEENSSPFIVQYPAIHVSITHCFPYCIGVVSLKPIGVDLEKINETHQSLVRLFYSDGENEILKPLIGTRAYNEQAMLFWTRKEAASKLFGLGMRLNFKQFDTTNSTDVHLESFICNEFAVSIACF